jgi:hypothetical protein
MKFSTLYSVKRGWLLLPLMLFWLEGSFVGVAAAAQPKISRIGFDGQEVVVAVNVPAGVQKVTLESRPRLGSGTWVPRAVSRLDGTGGDLTFRVPKSPLVEILRVRTDTDDVLPASFYKGTNSFLAGTSASDPSQAAAAPTAGAAMPPSGSNAASSTTRTVVESDIWNVSGDTLYFFNQYRGLQVIDLTTPDAPIVTGTFPLPAAGEQMYLLSGNYVVLLAQSGCGSDGQVVVLDASGGVPKQVASLTVPGWIQESRMVGTALYVASQASRPVSGSNDGAWEWGSMISSFDLSAPAQPAVKDSLWYSGWNNTIYATDQYLFVALQSPANWWQSLVQCIDISAPDGSMKALASVPAAGRVPDKFKLNQNGNVLSIISENWNTQNGSVITILENFSLANPTLPARLGRLELARGEQLHATRFDGNRVYVVTFYQVDPLWIVDLSDPSNPQIVGQLQVPGWSTYIEPLGDRLVAIGINNSNDWRVAVSLFDVHDSANPALLSKVPLGVNYSWSEANNDEKAFAVLPDSGLILVPYQGYETNGYASRVQLIDLGQETLQARGTIDHAFEPRRATLHNNRVYSVSGKELLAVDITDRDHPAVSADVELSWSVDRVFLAGDYVLEIANGNSWGGWWSIGTATPPSVRVIKASDPDHSSATLVLSNPLPVLGASFDHGKLYLVQGTGGYGPPILAPADGTPSTAQTNPPTLFLSVLDATALPVLAVVGHTEVVTDPFGWAPNLQPVWPAPGLLVWSGGGGAFWPLVAAAPVSGGAVGVGAPISGIAWWPWWFGGGGGRLLAFDVSASTTPKFVSELNLTTNAWWSFSAPFTANGLVYVSHQASEFVPGVTLPGQTAPTPTVTYDKATGQPITNQPPVGIWVERYYLDVVDYADPKSPTLRNPVNIPGELNGIAKSGALLYTVGTHWTNWLTDWNQWLDASAYDGVSAALVDSLALSTNWPHPLLVSDPNVFISSPDSTSTSSSLETWTIPDTGKFTRLGSVQLGSVTSALVGFGQVVAANQQNNTFLLFDATAPAVLVPILKGQVQGCVGYDLSNGDASAQRGLWLPLGDYGLWRATP